MTRKHLNALVLFLKLASLHPIDETNTKSTKIFYYFWCLISVTPTAVTLVQIVVFLALKRVDLIEDAITIMFTVLNMPLFFHIVLFQMRRETLKKLLSQIDEYFEEETDNGIELIEMKHVSKNVDRLVVFWLCSMFSVTTIMSSRALLKGNKALPIEVWWPFDYKPSPIYELAYLFQLLSQLEIALMFSIADLSFLCVSIIVGQQFKILASNLENSIYKSLLSCSIPLERVLKFAQNLDNFHHQNRDITNILASERFNTINLSYLKKNITHHQNILKCCESVNVFFSEILLFKTACALFYIVFITFSLISASHQSIVLFALILYAVSASIQLFMHTYSGEILTQSASITPIIWKCPWYLCSQEFKRNFAIVMMRGNKDVVTKAGNVIPMSAAAFLQVMKAVGSYVAALNTMARVNN